MNTKLIEELREWEKNYEKGTGAFIKFNEILSRHEGAKEEGLVEGLCGTCNGSGMVSMGHNIRGMKTCPTCNGKGKMTGTRATPSKAVEPLAVLADRKGCWIEQIENLIDFKKWVIRLGNIEGSCPYQFLGPTYAAAEAKARAYLEGLEDKKEGV